MIELSIIRIDSKVHFDDNNNISLTLVRVGYDLVDIQNRTKMRITIIFESLKLIYKYLQFVESLNLLSIKLIINVG
jgi:hypothetical protein